MRKLALTMGVALVAYLFVTSVSRAQDATGRVIGVVIDPAGAVVPGARITVTNSATGVSRETTSAGDGTYQVLLFPIAMYPAPPHPPPPRHTTPHPHPPQPHP